MKTHPQPAAGRLRLVPDAAITVRPQRRFWADRPGCRPLARGFNIPPRFLPRRVSSLTRGHLVVGRVGSQLRLMNSVHPLTAIGAVCSLAAGIRSKVFSPAARVFVLRDWIESR